MRRRIALVVSAALLVVTVGAGTAHADESVEVVTMDGAQIMVLRVSRTVTPTTGTGPTVSDFDGDGRDDVAAATSEMVTDVALPLPVGNGVAVRYSSVPRTDFLLGTYPSTDDLGSALSSGDFNGDGYDDLVLGAQSEQVPGVQPEDWRIGLGGGVWIIPGGADGLRTDAIRHFTQNSPGVPGTAEAGDIFGATLAAGDINGDGRDDLAIGAPGEAIGTLLDAGTVAVLFGGAAGLSSAGAIGLDQNRSEIPGTAETNDQFGFAVAIGRVNADAYADLVITSAFENYPDDWDGSGSVDLVWGGPSGLNLTGVTSVTGGAVARHVRLDQTYLYAMGFAAAVTDANGDGLGEVIVTAPGAQVGVPTQGGAVISLVGRATGLSTVGARVISQNTPGVPGTAEADDLCGIALAAGDVTGDGRGDVIIGCFGEDVGDLSNAGAFLFVPGTASGLTGVGAQSISQDSPNVPGSAEPDDEFAAAVAVLNLDGTGPLDVVVGAPREDVSGGPPGYTEGAVTLFLGSPAGLTPKVGWSGATLTNTYLIPLYYAKGLAPTSGLYS